MKNKFLFENGFEIELISRRQEFLGIGKIWAGKTLLRNGHHPMFVEIRTPQAVELCQYQIINQQIDEKRICLEFAMKRQEGRLMEWMLHTVRNRINTHDWTEPARPAIDTSLRLDLYPVQRSMGGYAFNGFSYHYHYRSRDLPIYKILDRGTWEIGGNTTSNQFWFRNTQMPPIFTFTSPDQFYSSESYLSSLENPNIFQFFPLQTQLQGFTMTTSAEGVLITWATRVSHIRSLIEKPRGSRQMFHWHEHCADLGLDLSSAPIEVLWLPGSFDRVEQINIYEAVRDAVSADLHAQIGMQRDRVTTYGNMEEWGEPDLETYIQQGIPKLTQAGIKTIFMPNEFQNNMNVWGVSNMCCTVDYQMVDAPHADQMKRLCQVARAGGSKIEMWGNTSLSTLTPIFDNRGEGEKAIHFLPKQNSVMEALSQTQAAWVKNPSNAIEADHYTPVFAVLNLRDPIVRAYWHRRWKEAHDQIGIDGIFLDSSFNLSSDKFHFLYNPTAEQAGTPQNERPACEPQAMILTQYHAHLSLMKEMQEYGYHYCAEDCGVFGISRSGPNLTFRLDNLFMWVDSIGDFNPSELANAGADPEAVFFQCLAYRLMVKINWNIHHNVLSFENSDYQAEPSQPTTWHLKIVEAYNQVVNQMDRRTVLPGETGVVYHSGETQVLWGFQDTSYPLEQESQITDLLTGEKTRSNVMFIQKHHIYRIESN